MNTRTTSKIYNIIAKLFQLEIYSIHYTSIQTLTYVVCYHFAIQVSVLLKLQDYATQQ